MTLLLIFVLFAFFSQYVSFISPNAQPYYYPNNQTACVYTTCYLSPKLVINVTGPAAITGSMAYSPVLAGASVPGNGVFSAQLIFPHILDDPYGCTPFQHNYTDDGTPFEGRWLVIKRGGSCNFNTLSLAMNIYKLAGLIVWDIAPQPVFPVNMPNNFWGDESKAINIPWLVITLEDGVILNSGWVKSGGHYPNITASVASSGYITPSNLQFLLDSKASMFFPYTLIPLNPFTNQRVMSSLSATYTPANDPCQRRIYQTWCENGELVLIDWVFLSIQGTMPSSIGNLRSLSLLLLGNNGLTGAFPSSICNNMPYLTLFEMSNNKFSSLPNCFDTFPLLALMRAPNNLLTTFPTSLATSKSITTIMLENNFITGQLPAVFQSNYLQVFTIGGNKLTGAIPMFSNANAQYSLAALDISANSFNSLDVNQFNSFPNLNTIVMGQNNFTGPLPAFSNCVGLTLIDVNSNKFTGNVPASWSSLPLLGEVNLARNALTSVEVLFGARNLVKTVASYNQIAQTSACDACCVIGNAAGSHTVYLDLSNNLLSGVCSSGILLETGQLQTLIVSHNQITNVPTDLFGGSIAHFDISYNNLQGAFPDIIPGSNVIYLNFQGNTNFKGSLPSFVGLSSTDSVTALGLPYLCQSLIPLFNPTARIIMDQSYYNFRGCTCNEGYYYTVPNCQPIPPSITIHPESALPVAITGGPQTPNSISDAWFGTRRSIPGLLTSWTIDATDMKVLEYDTDNLVSFMYYNSSVVVSKPPSATLDMVRMITLFIHIDLSAFLDGNNLNIYSGSSKVPLMSINYLNVNSLMSSDSTKWPAEVLKSWYIGNFSSNYNSFITPAVIKVPVVSNLAYISFETRSKDTKTFFLVYAFSSRSPIGYTLNLATNLYDKDLPLHEVIPGIRYGIYAASAVVSALVVATLLLLIKHQDTAVVKASSKGFTFFSLFMLLGLSIGASTYALVPSTYGDSVCHSRLWISCFCLMGFLGVIVAKSFRVNLIFGSKVLLQIKNASDTFVLKILLVLLSTQLIMLIIFSANRMTWPAAGSDGSDALIWKCETGNGFSVWLAVQIAIFALVMTASATVAFKTRNVPSAFNESSHILFTLQILLFFLILIVPLDWVLVNDSANASMVIQGGGQLILTIFMLVACFLPKAYYILTGNANNLNLTKRSGNVSSNLSSNSNSNMSSRLSNDGSMTASSVELKSASNTI